MKYITIIIALALSGCYNRERNCNDFRTGAFRFEDAIGGVTKISEFTRTENLQVETFEGKTDSSTVRWINDCEFVLQKINPKNMQEKKAVHMKILTTTENSYTFEYSFVGDTNKQKGTVTKTN